MEESEVDLQRFLHNLDSNRKVIELNTYIDETKVTANFAVEIGLHGETIEQVDKFFCLQSQLFWGYGKLGCQRICYLCFPQKVTLHQRDIMTKTKMCVFNRTVLLHNTNSLVISVEDLLKLRVTHMQWLRDVLIFTLRKYKRNLETNKQCFQKPILIENRNSIYGLNIFAKWKMRDYQSKSAVVIDQLAGNSLRTTPCLSWRKVLKEGLRTDSHKRYLCKDTVVKASSMDLDKVQWRGFAKDSGSFVSNNPNYSTFKLKDSNFTTTNGKNEEVTSFT